MSIGTILFLPRTRQVREIWRSYRFVANETNFALYISTVPRDVTTANAKHNLQIQWELQVLRFSQQWLGGVLFPGI
jgi:hypothetical protein